MDNKGPPNVYNIPGGPQYAYQQPPNVYQQQRPMPGQYVQNIEAMPQPSQLPPPTMQPTAQPPQPQQQQPPPQYHAEPDAPRRRPLIERIKSLIPPPVVLDAEPLAQMSVVQLCAHGREITHELPIRFMNLMTTLRMAQERRSNIAWDTESILVYIRFMLNRLVEVRLRVDRARAHKPRLSDDTFFDQITDLEPGEHSRTREERAVAAEMEQNRAAIIHKGNEIKKLEWFATVMSPPQD